MQQIRRTVFAAVLAVLVSVPAIAQEVSLGCYLVPQIDGVMTTFMPKYINSRDMPGQRWAAMPLGIEPTYLICANLTPAEHTLVAGQSDVLAFPENLDAAIGGNPTLNRVRNGLEQRNLPGEHFTAVHTWRQLIGHIGRNCLLLQRLNGLHHQRLFPPGVSLSSQPDALTFGQLSEAATSLGVDTSGVTAAMTIRQILNAWTAQLPPFVLLTETF